MAAATRGAAAAIPSAKSFLEKFVDEALADELRRISPRLKVVLRRRLPLPNWERLQGSTVSQPPIMREADLHAYTDSPGRPLLISEQKVWDFDASLFDVAKLLSFGSRGSVATYLVAAHTPRKFAEDRPGNSLFGLVPREWSMLELATGAWQRAWFRHLRNAGVAPCSLPMFFSSTPIAAAAVGGFPDHELRCVRVTGNYADQRAKFRQGFLQYEQPPELDAEDAAWLAAEAERASRARCRRRLEGGDA